MTASLTQTDSIQARYRFISHALEGDGPFRPTATADEVKGETALVAYPRESKKKFAGRNLLAVYRNPLKQACHRFTGYLTTRAPVRELPHPLYQAMADDVDGSGNAIDVFWAQFAIAAKARGAMLLLVDMPSAMPQTLGEQVSARVAPYFAAIAPELLTDFQVGDDGKFDYAAFAGVYTLPDGHKTPVTWRFDRAGWSATDAEGRVLDADAHPLGECPILIFSENGAFPCFGSFAEIADLSRDLFNQYSELREIHRSQNFSLLTMQVSETATTEQKLEHAKLVGETIGSSNMMVHTGQTPAFIAPADGPARNYLDAIALLTGWINETGLNVEMPDQQESGVALQMRFQALNAALSAFAQRMEDLERRAWSLASRWLAMTGLPAVQWPRDFALADVQTEIGILQAMQAAGMPQKVVAEQQKRIASIQFANLEPNTQADLLAAIDEGSAEV